MSALPKGWEEPALAQFAEFNPKHHPDADRDQAVSFVPMPAVDEHMGAITTPQERLLDEVWKGFTHFAEGDVIFAKITPCMENGKTAIARDLINGMACGSTEFHVLRPEGGVLPELIWRYFRQKSFRAEAEKQMTGAVGQRRVPRAYLEQLAFPLPPLAEQRRIVEKLDKLTARIRAAKGNLAEVQTLASRTKQATLAAAFQGELTADWRDDAPRSGWAIGKAADVCSIVQSGGTPKKDGFVENGGIPFLKVYNIVDQQVAFDYRPQFISEEAHSKKGRKSIILPGDVLMNIVGPPLGKVAIVTDEYPEWNCNQAITIFRPGPRISTRWIFYFLCSGISVASVTGKTRGVVGQVNISLSQCRSFEIPIPPLEEQTEIIRRIEASFARIDRMVAKAARAATLLERLEEQLLAKAFRGELVSQDPSDEPASALLARIREARTNAPKPKRRRKVTVK